MNKLMEMTQNVFRAFDNVNGNMKLNKGSMIGRMNPDSEVVAFLEMYLHFVMQTDIVSDVTRIFITSMENSPHEAIRAYNKNHGIHEQISAKKAANHFYYDSKRLMEFFPEDMITNLLYGKGDVGVYCAMLQSAVIRKMGRANLNQMTVLNLPVTVSSEVPSDTEMDEFFVMFAPYSKKVVSQVEQKLSKKVIGYLNYLSNKKSRTTEEEQVMNRLSELEND